MSSILAKINLTAHVSFLNTQCWTNTASSQLRVRFFQTSQLWCRDAAAYNARQRERYASDPEFRQRMLQSQAKHRAMGRPEHIQKYLNDQDYRESVAEKSRADNIDKEAKRQALVNFYKQNVNNYAQKHALLNWILRNKWTRRLFWETHEPLAAEDEKIPALCASCEGVYTRRLW
jgi:hypothetical protein